MHICILRDQPAVLPAPGQAQEGKPATTTNQEAGAAAVRARLRAHAAHAGPLKKAKASLSPPVYYLNCHTTPVPALWRAHTLLS